MILVLGASGYTGRGVVSALRRRDLEVRGFIRDPASEAAVRANGAHDVVIGDLRDIPAVEGAMQGVDGVWFIGPRFLPEESALGEAVIDAAVRGGVRRFVLSGVYHPTIRALVNHQTKRRIEDHLYKTDLEFTVLQPARFMHGLLLSSWKRMVEEGVLADAFSPASAFAYVDYDDVAEVAAIAFHEDGLVRGTFELSAPGQHTLHEIASELGEELGRPLRAERVPLLDYAPAASLLRNPYSAAGFNRLREYYDAYGFHGGNALVLGTILGRAPTDFGGALRALRQAAAPNEP